MSKPNANYTAQDGILLCGYQKKLKTMKKKYFILYEETASNCARLEYFDNEKKFKSGSTPKRIIKLKNCFNINRRLDTKYEYVIALSTKDGGFGIVLESEAEMLKWLEVLITLQRIDDTCDQSRQHYEHVWQVVVQRRGLAEEKGIIGNYHACLTPKSLTFIRIGLEKPSEHRIERIEFLLTTIRRCGDSQCYFYMEVGRQSSIGPGELWMETEDALIAQNMHTMILSAMSSKSDVNLEPMRKRSSSANEATKPISMLLRKQTHTENKPNSSSFHSGLLYGRERCDSLPSTRNRTLSGDSCNQNMLNSSRTVVTQGQRNQPLQNRHGNSPPFGTVNGCSESEESSLSIDEQDDSALQIPFRFHSRSSDGVIPEENSDEIFSVESKCIDSVDGDTLSNLVDVKSPISDIKVVSENKKTNSFLSDIIHLPKHIRSICSEYSGRSSKLPENKEQNYILMGPTSESNLSQQNIKDTGELDSFSSLCLVNRGTAANNINFLEYISDTNSLTESDMTTTVERPTRAYSIGSRLEHNRLKMRLCTPSDVDQTTSRVRAFSVGSRAKIPRCDLQRSLLNYKSAIEQNSNDSSNIIKNLTESSTNYQFLGLNSSREKKSTSAPLLIHKSQNSVDRMGDLMEIDFSKSPTNSSYQSNSSPSARIYPFSMSVPVTNHDQIESYKTFLSNSHLKASSSIGGKNCPKKSTTDNGYLEMKPVSISSTQNSVGIANKHVTNPNFNKLNECLSISPKTTINYNSEIEVNDNSEQKSKCSNYSNKTSQSNKIIPMEQNEKDNSNNCNDLTFSNIEENKTFLKIETDLNEIALKLIKEDPTINTKTFLKNNACSLKEHIDNNNKSISNYVNLTYQKDIETPTINSHTNLHNSDCINQSCPLEETKMEQTDWEEEKSSKDCSHISNLKNMSYDAKEPSQNDFTKEGKQNDFGYEILQIKSDSSLQSNKIIQRPNSIRLEKQSAHNILHRPSSANSGKISASSSVTCTCSSSALCTKNKNSNSIYRPSSISDSLYCVGSKRVENTSPMQKNIILSRPPSVSSERELNYATLDLPQCSSEKIKTVTNTAKSGEPKINNSQPSFSYAKINFEHDSSNNSASKY